MREKIAKKIDTLLKGNKEVEDTPTTEVPANMEFREIQANLSALLYIITEQQTLIVELLNTLLETGALTTSSLYQVTSAVNDNELTEAVYKDLHQRYTEYFLKTKWLLMSTEEQDEVVKGNEGLIPPEDEDV
jgi:hypothetical protein